MTPRPEGPPATGARRGPRIGGPKAGGPRIGGPTVSGPTVRRPAMAPAGALAGLALLGGAVVFGVLSFTALTWYATGGGVDSAGTGFDFADLHTDANALGAHTASAYFGVLGWALLAATVLAGVGARAVPQDRSAPAGVLRVVGFVLGVAGVVLTWYAPAQLFAAQRAAGGTAVSVWHDATYGFAFATLAFALAAVGAVLGPRGGSATIE